MTTTRYETEAARATKDTKRDLRTALEKLGFTAIHIRDTKNAPDKIRWQVDCLDPSGDAMIIHGLSFMFACINKGMEINFSEGCVWVATSMNKAVPKRKWTPRAKVVKPTGPAMDVIPWEWESTELRARRCADFLKDHRIIPSQEYEVALVRISRMGKSDQIPTAKAVGLQIS